MAKQGPSRGITPTFFTQLLRYYHSRTVQYSTDVALLRYCLHGCGCMDICQVGSTITIPRLRIVSIRRHDPPSEWNGFSGGFRSPAIRACRLDTHEHWDWGPWHMQRPDLCDDDQPACGCRATSILVAAAGLIHKRHRVERAACSRDP